MVKRLVKLLISLVVGGYDFTAGALAKLMGRTSRPGWVVLYYHAVPREVRARFARQMDALVRLTQPLPCDYSSELAPGRRYAAVSFDDGFVSVLENALPELEARRIPATLFIPTCCLGQAPSWLRSNGAVAYVEKVISAEVIRGLKDHRLLSIGSHSVSHPNFLKLDRLKAEYELSKSKCELETILGRDVTMFSFPHGAHNSGLVEMARVAGYRRVFSIEPEVILKPAIGVVTGRVEADPRDWAIEFRLKLAGAYRWMAKPTP